ncbi:hypothetical protein PsYK624_164690 [Phanerochaete sordida]|uniref:F-box domain-containing protein n=1 Tax=Phanerochaete sordida TaxID=48140 RepID=A0A9P3GWF4_9APHY|nr:hypothetical protein PsYK624_164690 [Phanerochaete sordida]
MGAKTTSTGRRGQAQKSSVEDSLSTSPKRDLLACSVACRNWHTVARAHVFRDVAFVVRAPHARKERKPLADFDRFLLDQPAAAAAIHSLRLAFPHESDLSLLEQVCVHDVAAVLGRMPQLARLHLRNVYLARNPDCTIDAPARRFALAELKVEYSSDQQKQVVEDDTEAMLQSGLFSRADTLHISSGWNRSFKMIPDLDRDDPPCDLAVDRLVVERAGSGPSVLTALRNTKSLEHLRALEVVVARPGIDGPDLLLKAPRFIALVAPQLEHRTIRLQRAQIACGTAVLDVSAFAQLRTLTLGIVLPRSIHSSDRALEHVLRSYPLPQLSRLGARPALLPAAAALARGAPTSQHAPAPPRAQPAIGPVFREDHHGRGAQAAGPRPTVVDGRAATSARRGRSPARRYCRAVRP